MHSIHNIYQYFNLNDTRHIYIHTKKERNQKNDFENKINRQEVLWAVNHSLCQLGHTAKRTHTHPHTIVFSLDPYTLIHIHTYRSIYTIMIIEHSEIREHIRSVKQVPCVPPPAKSKDRIHAASRPG